jgi:hypothetical protein
MNRFRVLFVGVGTALCVLAVGVQSALAQTTTTVDPKAIVQEKGGLAVAQIIEIIGIVVGFAITLGVIGFAMKKVVALSNGKKTVAN